MELRTDYFDMTIKELWLNAPEGQINKQTRDTILEWDENPSFEQITKTLSSIVQYGGSNDFCIDVLCDLLYAVVKNENNSFHSVSLN